MSSGTPSPKGLEGNGEGEEDSENVQAREFFWDSITLYVVFAIVALSSIDLVIEFIRQPEVRCFSRNSQDQLADYQDYVNEFCYGTSALSNINIFRICSYILGFAIAALHYLWLNHFGGKFAFFFKLVSDINRHRSEETGDYPKNNQIIADQLEEGFTTYQRNSIFWLYLVKVFLQLLLSIAGVIGIGYYFTQLRFDTSFLCPENMNATLDLTGPWPLTGEQVTCVYTSFPLLELLCIADMILLVVAIILLTASVLWCTASHTKELGYKDVAVFVFQTGLPSRYFIPNFKVPDSSCCQVFYSCFSSIPWLPWRGPRISTDLDFLMMRLFRTDGGLGHILKEILTLKEVKSLNDNDNRRYSLHNEEQRGDNYRSGDLVRKGDYGDLRWKFDKNKSPDDVYEDGVYSDENVGTLPTISRETVFRMPDTVRGAVVGFSSYVEDRTLALVLSFGSPSTGFATALGRVFAKVVSVNFTPYEYQPKEDEDKAETDDVINLTCAENALSEQTTKQKLIDRIHAARNELEFNFIVVTPIDKSVHCSTVNYLIYLLHFKKYLDPDAVLMTMSPHSISGKHVTIMEDHCHLDEAKIDFYQYRPPSTFFPTVVNQRVQLVKRKILVWPKFDTEDGTGTNGPIKSADDLPVKVVSSSGKFKLKTRMRFQLYSQTPQQPAMAVLSQESESSGVSLTMMPAGQTVHQRSTSPLEKQTLI